MSRAELNSLKSPYEGITPEYVVGHALRQRTRGKKPSVGFMGIKNPNRAIEVALGHIQSEKVENPTDVLELKDGSILAWVRATDSIRREEYVAVDLLSREPVEVRSRFIEEIVQWYGTMPRVIPDGQTPLSVVVSNMMHVTSSYELGNREPWVEAIDAVIHPTELGHSSVGAFEIRTLPAS